MRPCIDCRELSSPCLTVSFCHLGRGIERQPCRTTSTCSAERYPVSGSCYAQGNDCRDGGALAGLRGHGEPAANGFDTVLHAGQAMGVGAHAGGLEPLAIVLNLHGYIGGVVVHRDDDMAGPGVLADIGQRLLHHAIDRQLRGLGQVHLLQTALHLDVAAIAELPGQDFQCRGQSQVGKRGRAKVLDDATLECNAAVERLDQMGDALGDLGCRSVDLGFESRNIEFGCGQQRAKLIMQARVPDAPARLRVPAANGLPAR